MEKNKAIADFMGMKYAEERGFKDGEWTHAIKSLSNFEHDWNWLMTVVKEIYKIGEDTKHESWSFVYGHFLLTQEALKSASIKRVYDAVVAFVERYQNRKS